MADGQCRSRAVDAGLDGGGPQPGRTFQAACGVHLDADFAPTLALLDRLRGGEEADVVILTREALHDLAAKGIVAAESCVDLARSFVGIAVKAGTDHPDIATEPALRATLLGARSVAYSRIGASGILFAQLIEQHGHRRRNQCARRIIPSGFTAERLRERRGAISPCSSSAN